MLMQSPSSPERFANLGFAAVTPVSTLRSIAQLFGSSKPRCGIYLLEFAEHRFYIGQAVEVVRRFAQHRKNYDEIVGFSFIPTQRANLDDVERRLIRRAEDLGLVMLNTVHASNVVGDTDLDLVVSPSEQAEWLSDPTTFNDADTSSPIVLPISQLERFAEKFRRFKAHRLGRAASSLLQTYVRHCIPAPKRTEYSFWVVSCLPSTNHGTWPRLFCISAGVMELLVVGYHKSSPSEMWGFVTVASDVLSETFRTDESLEKSFPSIELVRREYRDAGQHQISLHADTEQCMKAILGHKAVRRAAATLALRVMRKRATIYTKFHCKQLAGGSIGGALG